MSDLPEHSSITLGTTGQELMFDAEGRMIGGFLEERKPPANAVIFTEDSWIVPSFDNTRLPLFYRTQVYVTIEPKWLHLWDKTECDHGVEMPMGEWVETDWPMHCRGRFMVIPTRSDQTFYIEDLPIGWQEEG